MGKINILKDLVEALKELEDLERKVDNEMQKK